MKTTIICHKQCLNDFKLLWIYLRNWVCLWIIRILWYVSIFTKIADYKCLSIIFLHTNKSSMFIMFQNRNIKYCCLQYIQHALQIHLYMHGGCVRYNTLYKCTYTCTEAV